MQVKLIVLLSRGFDWRTLYQADKHTEILRLLCWEPTHTYTCKRPWQPKGREETYRCQSAGLEIWAHRKPQPPCSYYAIITQLPYIGEWSHLVQLAGCRRHWFRKIEDIKKNSLCLKTAIISFKAKERETNGIRATGKTDETLHIHKGLERDCELAKVVLYSICCGCVGQWLSQKVATHKYFNRKINL